MANITWEQIANANTAIGTTPIKGKDYAEVNQRVKAFRMVYPTGLIDTEMLANDNGVCVIKATAGYYAEDGHFVKLATGMAFEVQNASYINKTSYIENCETSAVGRCLGFCGFGIDTSICSAEELNNALEQQNPQKSATAVNPNPVQEKPIPTEIFGVPIIEDDKPAPVRPKDTPEEAQYRILCMRKFKLAALDKSCINHFKTDFRHTPVKKLRTVLPEDVLNY
jgi:hypothetical protein